MPATPLTPDQRFNFTQLYADVFWYGVAAGSAIAFLVVYAARLGASTLQMGLLTGGPAIINLLMSLPAGRWLENRPLARTTFVTSLWHRAGYLVLVVLPWAVVGAQAQVWAVVALTLFMSIPGTLLAIAFNAMFADAVPPEWRAQVVGRRNALLSLSVIGTSLVCGAVLDRVAFPFNYQMVFVLGVIGSALSSVYLGRLRPSLTPPARVNQLLDDLARPGLNRFGDAFRLGAGLRFLTRARGQRLLRLDLLRGSFGRLLAAYYLFYMFQYLPIPLFPLFQVNELHLRDSAISWGSALFYALMLLCSLALARVSQRWGHQRVLMYSAVLYSVYPLILSQAHAVGPFWVASALGGAAWALTNGGLINRLMERVPEDDRPAHMALHNLALNLGVLSGSLLGPLLGQRLDLRQALLLSGLLRLLGGLLLGWWG